MISRGERKKSLHFETTSSLNSKITYPILNCESPTQKTLFPAFNHNPEHQWQIRILSESI